MQILMIQSEEDDSLATAEKSLISAGFNIIHTQESSPEIEDISASSVDLVIIQDSGNGCELCTSIKATTTVPIIGICDAEDEIARVSMLESGADFSMSKPISNIELVARAHSLIRYYRGAGRL